MKYFFTFCMLLLLVVPAKSQTISPTTDNEFCPNTEYTFTASLNYPYQSMFALGGCTITQFPTGTGQYLLLSKLNLVT